MLDLEYLQDLIENVNDLVMSLRPDGSFLYVNRAWRDTLGYGADEIARLSVFDVIHPDSRDHCGDVFRRVLAGESFDSVEATFQTRAGRPVVVEASVNCRFRDGRPVATRTILRNITERKQAEAALRESEARFHAFMDNSPVPAFLLDEDLRLVYANRSYLAMYDLAANSVGQPADYVPTDFAAQYGENFRAVVAAGEPLTLVETYPRPDGALGYGLVCKFALTDAAGRRLLGGVGIDITDLKRAEQAARDSQHMLRMVLDNIPQGVFWKDRESRYLGCNRVVAHAFGLASPEDVVGKFDHQFNCLTREQADFFVAKDREVMAADRPELGIIEPATLADGTSIWMETNKIPMHDAEGRVVGVLGTWQDVTERKRAEEERRKLDARIQHAQKLESLGVLAGGIAHDFNNLLTSVMGYAGLALMKLPDESVACPMLREIEKAAQRAADLTQQMLAYSGRGKFVIQVLRLDTLVREMTKLMGTVVSRKAALTLDLAPATLEGDATQVRQVVMNLITNASDALEGRAGVIGVRTGVRHAEPADLRSPFLPDELPAGAYAFVEVEDDGCGMAEDTLARIFDPFFTTKFTGRGLGLAAALGIIKGHRGTIRVDTGPGRGTVFTVLFPCFTGSYGDAVAAPDGRAAPTCHGTVLVVEDEPSLRAFVRRVLEDVGFQVLEACDGRDGVAQFGRHRAEIVAVLLDLTMPHMDGRETLAELRRLHPGLPVLVMSGFGELEIAVRLAGSGASGFIQKPFHPRDLIARVCELLPSTVAESGP